MYALLWWGCGVRYQVRADGTMVEHAWGDAGCFDTVEEAQAVRAKHLHTAIYTADGRLVR